MKRRRDGTRYWIARVLAALGLVVALAACSRDPRLDALVMMESPQAGAPSSERVQELKETIAEYERIVSQKVEAALKQASYLKLLAQEYMRTELYGPALESLQEALFIEPRNQVLHQLAGVCAGYLAKAQVSANERSSYLSMAEAYYLHSLEIDPNYEDGLYALGALYHFELARQLEAIAVLERLLDRAPNHVQGLFVLARSHAVLGNVEQAAETYSRIMETSADSDVVGRARRNRQLLLGEAE